MTSRQGVAVVTGAGSGLGRAIAKKLAADGFAVAIIDLDEGAARETARLIGSKATPFQADVSRAAELDRAGAGGSSTWLRSRA
ncbi:MAG: SDR family NAD(P)-dependent oxidoreductase [Burkholderiales bacterium]